MYIHCIVLYLYMYMYTCVTTCVAAQTTRVYTWSRNLLEHSGMTHALINNTVSIFIVRVELCYLSSHAQREPLLSLSLTITLATQHAKLVTRTAL